MVNIIFSTCLFEDGPHYLGPKTNFSLIFNNCGFYYFSCVYDALKSAQGIIWDL